MTNLLPSPSCGTYYASPKIPALTTEMKTTPVLIAGMFVCFSASLLAQDKPASVLIPTSSDAEVYDAENGPGNQKALAPQLPKPIYSLGGAPTYDLRQVVKESGVALGEKDVVLYSADSHLLYARSSAENITIIKTLFEPQDLTPSVCSTEFEVRRINNSKTQRGERLAAFRFPTAMGETSEIALYDSAEAREKKMTFEVQIGPDAKGIDFTVSGQLPFREEDISLKLHSYGQIGTLIKLYESSKTPSSGPGLLVTLKLVPIDTATPTQEWLDHKIGQIEKELKDGGE